jgi:hypothetical protein
VAEQDTLVGQAQHLVTVVLVAEAVLNLVRLELELQGKETMALLETTQILTVAEAVVRVL